MISSWTVGKIEIQLIYDCFWALFNMVQFNSIKKKKSPPLIHVKMFKKSHSDIAKSKKIGKQTETVKTKRYKLHVCPHESSK